MSTTAASSLPKDGSPTAGDRPVLCSGVLTAHATYHLILLVDRTGIATIARLRHTIGDHSVGEGGEIDTKKLCAPSHPGRTAIARTRLRGILGVQHRQEVGTEFWGSRQAQEIALAEWSAEVKFRIAYWIPTIFIVWSNIRIGDVDLCVIGQAREAQLTLQASEYQKRPLIVHI
jgi:hypothetical protein